MSKHTPGPWEAEELKIISTPLQSVVAVCDIYDRDAPDEEEDANVRLIVTAVNHYEQMHKLLTILSEPVPERPPEGARSLHFRYERLSILFKQGKARVAARKLLCEIKAAEEQAE